MKKYIFATDVDGTLLMDNGQVHPETYDAFKKASNLGHTIVIATGRALVRTLPLLKKLPFVDYFVCNNGSLIYDVKNNKTVFLKTVNPQHYLKMVEFVKENKDKNVAFKLHTDKDWIGTIASCDVIDKPTFLDEELDAKIKDYISKNDNKQILPNQYPTQMSINANEKFCEKHYNDFKNWFGHDSEVFLTNSIFLDVNPKGTSKWTSLVELGKMLNIDKESIVTFGDSGNDLEMLIKANENGWAMGNSKPDLLKFIKPKIGTNNTNAIAIVILNYLH